MHLRRGLFWVMDLLVQTYWEGFVDTAFLLSSVDLNSFNLSLNVQNL